MSSTVSNLRNVYNARLKDYQNYIIWLNNRNSTRRELEEKFGYDTKHASNLIRLSLEAQELLVTGRIEFPLSYAHKVLNVLNGSLTYEQVLEVAENLQDKLKSLEDKSPLRKKPNVKKVQDELIKLYKNYL